MPTTDFGIDLGTTNSSVACCRRGEVRIFQSNELMNVTPSVVYVGKTGRMVVGKRAYDAWPADPQNTQAEFKRWMGFADKLNFPAANLTLSAEELSAEVLKSLRADVRRATGEDVTATVITVPAAFGALQCDATGRAAKLAGFDEAPLLQEPIAAAIAYGASAAGPSQRWVVFDLGGGTLDIAVVSTRNDRLAVLEHQGNNRLGGKDIDRAIAEHLLLEPLAEQFKLPDRLQQPNMYDRLFRHLVRLAEQAKVALSTAETVPVDVFNVGDDLTGMPIEASLTLTRADVERRIEPLLNSCLDLVKRALDGARISAADVDRVLLVGGPTQMPVVRQALVSALGDKLDHSIDPMTAVARGAALYASTIERTTSVTPSSPGSAGDRQPVAKKPAGTVLLTLSHERASGTLQSPVAGVVAAGRGLAQVKIDAQGGVWSSGWIPVNGNRFAAEVMLTAGKPVTRFTIAGRGASGGEVPVSPAEFSIAHMLPMGAPPLPHTIAIELSDLNGVVAYDPVFARHTPLPAEARKTYRADRTLRPSELDATLPIKFWEVEVSDDPRERWWAGCVHVRADRLRRPLMEGTDIELTIKIDASRRMTVDVFVPQMNQGFSGDVFVPDPPTARSQLQQQLDLCFERVGRLFETLYAAGRDDLRERAEQIQFRLESIAEQVNEEHARAAGGHPDPDALLVPAQTIRKLQLQITQLEEQLESERNMSPFVIRLKAEQRWTAQLVQDHGTAADREMYERLAAQTDRYVVGGDQRGLKFVSEQMLQLRASINHNRQTFWTNWLSSLKQPGQPFLNQAESATWLAKADEAASRNDLDSLRTAVRRLWELMPPDRVEAAKDQAMQSGLKGG